MKKTVENQISTGEKIVKVCRKKKKKMDEEKDILAIIKSRKFYTAGAQSFDIFQHITTQQPDMWSEVQTYH